MKQFKRQNKRYLNLKVGTYLVEISILINVHKNIFHKMRKINKQMTNKNKIILSVAKLFEISSNRPDFDFVCQQCESIIFYGIR